MINGLSWGSAVVPQNSCDVVCRPIPEFDGPVEQAEPALVAGQVAQGTRRDQARPLRVLFVCTANICRSPFMELLARHLAGPDSLVEFFSAGTHGFEDHPMDDIMATTLLRRGLVEPGSFRSRPLTSELIGQADLLLTAETAHRSFILDEHPASFRKVFTLGQFVNATRGVAPTLHGQPLLDEIGRHRGAADPTMDVTDPFRRGLEAADSTAHRIERLLHAALPALIR